MQVWSKLAQGPPKYYNDANIFKNSFGQAPYRNYFYGHVGKQTGWAIKPNIAGDACKVCPVEEATMESFTLFTRYNLNRLVTGLHCNWLETG